MCPVRALTQTLRETGPCLLERLHSDSRTDVNEGRSLRHWEVTAYMVREVEEGVKRAGALTNLGERDSH